MEPRFTTNGPGYASAAPAPKGQPQITGRLAGVVSNLDDIWQGLLSLDSRLRAPRPMDAAGEDKGPPDGVNAELSLDRIERRISQIGAFLSDLSNSV